MSSVHEADGAAGSDSSVLADLIDGLTARMQAGYPIDWEGLARQHPEHAGELLRLRPALGALGDLSKSGAEELSGLASPVVAWSGDHATTAASDGLLGGVLGDFRIQREVGRGGMGVVYEAEQVSLGRRVALKVLPFAGTMDPRHLQRFQNEARAAACLHHTNIVPVYSVGSERGVSFYAMQFIDGQTLAAVIQEMKRPPGQAAAAANADVPTTAHEPHAGPVDAKEDTAPAARQSTLATLGPARNREFFRRVAELGVQAAEALDHAHQLGVVHRDVKPGNLLLDAGGRLWVADFGLAHMQHGDASLTMTGDLVGTLRYMSPEQALAKRVPIDHRTDVYSLGATLYEMLTLRPAFEGNDRQEVLRQIAFEEPKPPRRLDRKVPAELEVIVLKAMEKNAAERYGTAQEVADDLRRWLDDRPIQARRPSWARVAAKWARRHKPLLGAAAAVLLMAMLLGVGADWVAHDKAMKRAETARVVGQALDESASWQQQRRLPEAQSAARRAAGLVAGGEADDALRERVRARSADLELLGSLENARLELSAVYEDHFDYEKADNLYAAAFRDYGLDVEALPPEEAGERLRRSTVAAEAAAMLDHWSMTRRKSRGPTDGSWTRILGAARAADLDAWRNGVREALERGDNPALEDLTRSDEVFGLLPATLDVLARALEAGGAPERAEALLAEAQARNPDDFWLNLELGVALAQSKKSDEALGYFRGALAVRPFNATARGSLGNALCDKGQLDEGIREYRRAIELAPRNALPHSNLGNALRDKGQPDEAIRECRRAIELDPKYATAHSNLGNVLLDKGQPDEAIREYRRAIELDPKDAVPHCGLGKILLDKGQPDEAIQECRRAIELDPKLAPAHSNLGNALRDKGQPDEAIREYRRAIELDPKVAQAHGNLGFALRTTGKLTESLDEFRVGHRLGTGQAGWAYPSAKWVQQAELLVEADRKLAAVLEGKEKPADDAERIALAQLCQQPFKKRYAAATRFYMEAFAAEPALAETLDAADGRYAAACAAALAGCGRGEDAPAAEADRARLRSQALEWLRADLAAWKPRTTNFFSGVRTEAIKALTHWREDDDLAGVRDADALAKLPDAERQEWQKLWQEVEVLLKPAARQP